MNVVQVHIVFKIMFKSIIVSLLHSHHHYTDSIEGGCEFVKVEKYIYVYMYKENCLSQNILSKMN